MIAEGGVGLGLGVGGSGFELRCIGHLVMDFSIVHC